MFLKPTFKNFYKISNGVNKNMPAERSAGAVIFRNENNKIYYLLLHYPSSSKAPCLSKFCSPATNFEEIWAGKSKMRRARDYWDFPKGHIEKGETIEETIRREVGEETGLTDIRFIEGFKEGIKYFFKIRGKNVLKFVTFYLAETKEKDVKVSFEHLGFEWLPFEMALERLTFDNAKQILKKADLILNLKRI